MKRLLLACWAFDVNLLSMTIRDCAGRRTFGSILSSHPDLLETVQSFFSSCCPHLTLFHHRSAFCTIMRISNSLSVALFLKLSLLSSSTTAQSRRELEENDDFRRDLAILMRPPLNYDPESPGTGCVEPNTFLDTDVVVEFKGDPGDIQISNLDQATLEDAFQESYNTLRKKFCDNDSRQVMDVTLDQESLVIKSYNVFSLRFIVDVGCDRCDSLDTNLFEPEPNINRRQRELHDGGAEESNSSLESRNLRSFKRPWNAIRGGGGASPPSPNPITSFSPPSPSPIKTAVTIPRVDEECCPTNGERRAPYASEFADAFGSTYKVIRVGSRALQQDPIQEIVAVIEVTDIGCDEPLEEFETEVDVELLGNPEDVLDSEVFALEASFKSTFNDFANTICDPLFRTVTDVSATLEDILDERYLEQGEGERKLQRRRRRSRFKYRVKGRCRGCKSSARLFAQGSSERRLEMKFDRQLQYVYDDDSCFCAVGAEPRGILEDDFRVSYDSNIQVLKEEGVLVNIDGVDAVEQEPLWTWSPTTSPTINPTAPTDSPVPSPSPSSTPTSS